MLVGAIALPSDSTALSARVPAGATLASILHAHKVLAGAQAPPAEARHVLEDAHAAARLAEQLLFGALAERKGALERLRDGRRALAGYSRA